MVTTLLKADTSARLNKNEALMHSVSYNKLDMVSALLENGANTEDNTALQ